MKKLLSLFLLMLFICCAAQSAQAQQSNYIRLHIIASSDSLNDQALKLLIRDDIREYTSALLKETAQSDEAWAMLQTHESEILNTARTAAERYGFTGEISIETGIFDFPDRTYGDELVSAGEYRAVRIRIGEAQGRNWWCVLYPALCLPSDADMDKPVEFYSSLCRWAVRLWEVIAS